MEVLDKVKELYQFYLENEIDTNTELMEFEFGSQGFQMIENFDYAVMQGVIADDEIKKIISYLARKKDALKDYIIENLMCNKSFFLNDTVKEDLSEYVEQKIFEDIEEFDLHGEKSKIIDFLYVDDIESIYPILEKLEYKSKCDILTYIMENSYHSDIIDNTSKIGALFSLYKTTLDEIYSDENGIYDNFGEYEEFDEDDFDIDEEFDEDDFDEDEEF